jgi:AcrR family transcriptional regulator
MPADTKTRLLDHAECLFAARGIPNTSVRDIVTAADVNLGAITYHFGSKNGLIRAVIERRLRPLNEERLRLLKQAEEAAAPSPPSLENVLRAAIAPTLGLMREHAPFMQIVGRMFSDPNSQFKRRAEAKPLFRRFMRDIACAVPHVPPEELVWRVHFLRGALIYTWTSAEQLRVVPRGRARPEDDAVMVRRLIQFGAAGLRASLGESRTAGRPRKKRRTRR